MQKELPFNNDPIIKTYPYFINYFGILQGNNIDITSIVINNFLNLFYIPFTGQVNFLYRKRLKYLLYKTDFTIKGKNVIQFIKDKIINDEYIIMYLDDRNFNLTLSENLGVHNWIVLGFDDINEIIKVAGYLRVNGCNVFKTLNLKFDEFENAVVKRLSIQQKRRISSNHICKLDKSLIVENKIDNTLILKKIFTFKYINSIVLHCLIIHNYNFSYFPFNPYKRNFLDLRDLRIIYEQLIATKVFFSSLQQDRLIKLCDDIIVTAKQMLNIASMYHIKNNKKEKRQVVKLVNKKLKQIIYFYKKISKILFVENVKKNVFDK